MNKQVTPTVSVICTTYNHAKFISKALDSMLAQQCDFAIEILINDDHSIDGTVDILQSYQKKYPGVIKLNLQKENQYSRGVRNMMMRFLLPKARGKYIALCEGDDYWTDPHKLQKQVDYMEDNPDHSLCFHRVNVVFENGEKKDEIFPKTTKGFTLKKLLEGNYIQTNSVMYRRQDYNDLDVNVMPGDWYLHLYHAQFGKIGFLPDIMAVYRRHPGGVWWNLNRDPYELWKNHGVGYMALYAAIMQMYGAKSEYREIIERAAIDMYNRLLTVDKKFGTQKVSEATEIAPSLGSYFIAQQNQSISQQSDAIHRLLTDLSRANEELQNLRTSRSFVTGYLLLHPWKAPRRLAGIVKRTITKLSTWVKRRQKAKLVAENYKQVATAIGRNRLIRTHDIAVVLHLYYIDMWPYFRDRLAQLDGIGFDLYVSVAYGNESIADEIRVTYPEACVYGVPNHGRDVLPFLQTLQAVASKKYQYVLKLHSKKSKHRDDGNVWFTNIIDHLIPSERTGIEALMAVLKKHDTGIVGPAGEYMTLPVNYENNKYYVRRLLTRLKSHRTVNQVDMNRFDYGFFAGTMFWARFDAIEPVLRVRRRLDDFALERGQIDGTVAHAYERIFCLLPELNGRLIYEIGDNQIQQIPYKTSFAPEWSNVYEPINTSQD